jgi:hypothetical protein
MGSCMFLKTADKKIKNPLPISEEPNTTLQKRISETIDINIPIDLIVDEETVNFKKASLRKKDTEFSIDSPMKNNPPANVKINILFIQNLIFLVNV